jgi:hypothetical protein
MHSRFITIILLTLVLSACSSTTQASFPTETLQLVIAPTFTELPATFNPEPENTPTIAPTTTPEPKNTPTVTQVTWQGIPVIPGATGGRPQGFGYTYSVNLAVEKAEQFYMEEMEDDGWTLSNRQTGETNMPGLKATTLDFRRDNEAVAIVLNFGTDDDYTIVYMLMQFTP